MTSNSTSTETGQSGKAFFYGTLMCPEILKNVIRRKDLFDRLQIAHAVLLDYTRHKVKNVTYPAIIPYWKSLEAFNHDLAKEDQCVRGTLVTGLTTRDFEILDVFEGDEYIREVVDITPLAPLTSMAKWSIFDEPASTPTNLVPVKAEVYVFSGNSISQHLESSLWDFDAFMKYDAWKWSI